MRTIRHSIAKVETPNHVISLTRAIARAAHWARNTLFRILLRSTPSAKENKSIDSNFQEATIYVEREGENKYKLNSAQLDRIGTQLRGKPRFSIFHSIVLPLIISVATIVFSTVLQYISWTNSIRLQNATDLATKASVTYERAASAIGKRHYATFLFVPSARDLINYKNPIDNEVYKTQTALNKRRFDAYYEELRNWNENYDQLITDIDYNLDRPILLQARLAREGNEITVKKTDRIDCTSSLREQLPLIQLNRHSLKGQFASIARCLFKAASPLAEQKDRAVLDKSVTINDSVAKTATSNLEHLMSMANEFRCHALLRIEYYNSRKSEAIVSPLSVIRWLNNTQVQSATNHFAATERRC
jgi:hypothetical protein